ncbi:MAG: hypothetical protein WBD41_09675 [Rhodococcus sp. (in: high G+C Gram-positive bacteria)]|jgi:hypothetical protein
MSSDFTDPSPEIPVEDRVESLREDSDLPTTVPAEADPADFVDQHIEVPIDDEER